MNTTYGKLQSSPTGTGLGLAFNFPTFTTSRHSAVFLRRSWFLLPNDMATNQETLSFKIAAGNAA
jgi:hypothetical protein